MGSGSSAPEASAPQACLVPSVCRTYNSSGQCDWQNDCLELHICLGYAAGKCLFGERCSRSHLLSTLHNQLVLQVNGWSQENQNDIRLLELVKEKIAKDKDRSNAAKSDGLVTPPLCMNYNTLGCQNSLCSSLHLCLNFVLNRCSAPEGKCHLEHDLAKSEHNIRVLKSSALLDTEQRVIVENLREKYNAVSNQAKTEQHTKADQAEQQEEVAAPKAKEEEAEATSKQNVEGAKPKPQGTPSACIDYNKRVCAKPSCPFLHICFAYIMGRCNKRGHCPKEHNIFRGERNREILRQFDLLDATDVIGKIRAGYDARRVARAAAAESSGGAGATGGAAPSPAPSPPSPSPEPSWPPGDVWTHKSLPASLTCPVCLEAFIRATTLGCTHTFCEDCVVIQQRQGQPCPLCRAPITTAVRSLVIDDTVVEWFDAQDDETQRARRQLESKRRRDTTVPPPLMSRNVQPPK